MTIKNVSRRGTVAPAEPRALTRKPQDDNHSLGPEEELDVYQL